MALLLVLGFVTAPVVVADDTSTHAVPYLRMGAGTRALGMGGAHVAAGRDATVGYYNPAGLAWMPGTQISAMYALGMDADRSIGYVAGAHQFDWGALGATFLTAGTDDIQGYNSQDEPTEEFGFRDIALMAHGAYLYNRVAVGATLKYLHQGVGADVPGDDGVSGVGFDVGASIRPTDWLSVGVALRDLASEVGGDEEANNVPMNLRIGTAFMPLYGLTFAFDYDHVENQSNKILAGGEYAFGISDDVGAALRLGLNGGHLTAGLGVGVSFVEFDYAFIDEPEDFLGTSHRVGVTLRLGEARGPALPCGRGPRAGDSDLDGIPDGDDKCPNAAEDLDGFEDSDGCPDPDNDGDGVFDVNDDCPKRAEDFDGYADSDGCPDPDNDGDGILDENDKCPNAAETINNFEDSDGCPDAMPEHLRMANINFKFGSAEFSGADPLPILDDIVALMKKNPDMKLKVTGFTDNVGTDEANQKLSERRSERVRDYLVERGISAARLSTFGRGENDPIDTNDTDAGRARNRRIEFTIVP